MHGLTWAFATFASLLLLVAVRVTQGAFGARFAVPFAGALDPAAVALWGRAVPALAAAAAAVALLGLRAARRRGAARAWLELLLLTVAAMAAAWLLPGDLRFAGPRAGDGGLGPAALAAAAAWLGGGLWLLRRDRAAGEGPRCTRAGVGRLARRLLWPTAVPAVALVAAGLAAGERPAVDGLAISLALYPLYALIQMLLLLALPAARLRRLGAGPAGASLGCAALFALAHWPNGPLLAACFLAMLWWARLYLSERAIVPLAVAMGILATAFVQLLPETFTANARVGPRWVRKEASVFLASPPSRAAAGSLGASLPPLYEALAGRPPTTAEAAAWDSVLARRAREHVARLFLTSDEHAARVGAKAAGVARRLAAARAARGAGDEALARQASGGRYDAAARAGDADFLRALYRLVLAREPADAEVAAWAPSLTSLEPAHRERLAAFLFDRRRALARGPLPPEALSEFRLPFP